MQTLVNNPLRRNKYAVARENPAHRRCKGDDETNGQVPWQRHDSSDQSSTTNGHVSSNYTEAYMLLSIKQAIS